MLPHMPLSLHLLLYPYGGHFMPSISKKQHNLFELVAHDESAAKRLGIPQSVGKEFAEADKKTGKWRMKHSTACKKKDK
jgi:hypothetical protein